MVERGERNISLSNIGVFAKYFEMTVSEFIGFRGWTTNGGTVVYNHALE